MSSFTDRGVREVGASLKEARQLIAREMADARSQIGILEVKVSGLGKMLAALDMSLEMLMSKAEKP